MWSLTQRSFLFGEALDGTVAAPLSLASKGKAGSSKASSSSSSSRLAPRRSSASASLRLFSSRSRPRAVVEPVASHLCSLRTAIHELDVEARQLQLARRALLHSYHQLHQHSTANLTQTETQPRIETDTDTASKGVPDLLVEVKAPMETVAAAARSAALCPSYDGAAPTQSAAHPAPSRLPPPMSSCSTAGLSRCGFVRHSLRLCQCSHPLPASSELEQPLQPHLAAASHSSLLCSPLLPATTLAQGCLSLWRLSSAAPSLSASPFVPFLSAMFLHNKHATPPPSVDHAVRKEESTEQLGSASPPLQLSHSASSDQLDAAALSTSPLCSTSVCEVNNVETRRSSLVSSSSSQWVAAVPLKEGSQNPRQTTMASARLMSLVSQPLIAEREDRTCNAALTACAVVTAANRQPHVRQAVDEMDVPSRSPHNSCCGSAVGSGPPRVSLLDDVMTIDVDDGDNEWLYEKASVADTTREASGALILPVSRAASLSALARSTTVPTSPSAGPSLLFKRTLSLPSISASPLSRLGPSQTKAALQQPLFAPIRPPLSPLSSAALNRRQATPQQAVLTQQQRPRHQREETEDCFRYANVAAHRLLPVARAGHRSPEDRLGRTHSARGSELHAPATPAAATSKPTSTPLPASTSSKQQPASSPHSHSASAVPHTSNAPTNRLPASPLLPSAASVPSMTPFPSTAFSPVAPSPPVSSAPAAVRAPAALSVASSAALVPLSSAQCSLSFSVLHGSFRCLFGGGSVPLFAGCAVGDLQRWMGELGLKQRSKAQMADKLTHIFQHYAAEAAATTTSQRPQSEAQQRSTWSAESTEPALHEASQPRRAKRTRDTADAELEDGSSLPAPLGAAMACRLRAFIRHHSALYLRMLLLQTVDLQSLLVSCNGAGIAVSREQLVHFLDEEGVAFAQTPNLRHGNRSRQKRHRAGHGNT